MGKGKISTKTFALILAHPGKPIYYKTGVPVTRAWISTILRQPPRVGAENSSRPLLLSKPVEPPLIKKSLTDYLRA